MNILRISPLIVALVCVILLLLADLDTTQAQLTRGPESGGSSSGSIIFPQDDDDEEIADQSAPPLAYARPPPTRGRRVPPPSQPAGRFPHPVDSFLQAIEPFFNGDVTNGFHFNPEPNFNIHHHHVGNFYPQGPPPPLPPPPQIPQLVPSHGPVKRPPHKNPIKFPADVPPSANNYHHPQRPHQFPHKHPFKPKPSVHRPHAGLFLDHIIGECTSRLCLRKAVWFEYLWLNQNSNGVTASYWSDFFIYMADADFRSSPSLPRSPFHRDEVKAKTLQHGHRHLAWLSSTRIQTPDKRRLASTRLRSGDILSNIVQSIVHRIGLVDLSS